MIVCGHGNVSDFCAERDMVVCERYEGDLSDYRGSCTVVVSDQDMSEGEYYYLKGSLLNRGIELISTRYKDNPAMLEYLAYMKERQREKYGGRQPFGYYRRNGEVIENPEMMAVVRRILELRDAGITLRGIQEDAGVHHPDGRKISISTIQQIIKNRDRYEN